MFTFCMAATLFSITTLLGSPPACLSKERAMSDFVYELYELENRHQYGVSKINQCIVVLL